MKATIAGKTRVWSNTSLNTVHLRQWLIGSTTGSLFACRAFMHAEIVSFIQSPEIWADWTGQHDETVYNQ